jgi:8-oxo-dGTP pyrophosphatase MutT (NUDIX family)
MKKISQFLSIILYWATWPASLVIINGSQRSRILIKSEEEILVVKPWINNNKWSLVGGGIHKTEKPVEGAIREALEETKFKFSEKDLTYIGKSLYSERGVSFMCHYFIAVLPAKINPKLTFELVDFKWIKIDLIKELATEQDVVTAISLAEKY